MLFTILVKNLTSPFTDHWETVGSQHGARLRSDRPCQPSPHCRSHRQVRNKNLGAKIDLRSNSVSLSSSVWHSLSLRSLAELISWDSPLKLSPPLSSSSGKNTTLHPSKQIIPHLLSVGLALDYAAHIGVTYVVTKGKSRRERAQASVSRFRSHPSSRSFFLLQKNILSD